MRELRNYLSADEMKMKEKTTHTQQKQQQWIKMKRKKSHPTQARYIDPNWNGDETQIFKYFTLSWLLSLIKLINFIDKMYAIRMTSIGSSFIVDEAVNALFFLWMIDFFCRFVLAFLVRFLHRHGENKIDTETTKLTHQLLYYNYEQGPK